MLRELSVQNLAVIEDVRVELEPGFCAWTGETGAGKSLLLGAIGLLLGERGNTDLLRSGHEELRVTGRFELIRPEQRRQIEAILQGQLDGDDLILTRRLARSGRSTALVNEQPVAVATLRRIGELLVDIHGQRESYSLLQPAYQLDLLDAFGKLTILRAQYQAAAEQVRQLRQQLQDHAQQQETRQRELALIRFEREELEAARLQVGERKRLEAERQKLLNTQALTWFSQTVAEQLYDAEESIAATLGRLLKEAIKWSSLDPQLAEVARRLAALKPEIEDLADTCRDLAEQFEADPERLEAIEHRLQALTKLEAKYQRNTEELIAYRDRLSGREAELTQNESRLEAIRDALKPAFARFLQAAKALSKARNRAALQLAAETQTQLADLHMSQARLEAVLNPIDLGDDAFSGEIPLSGAEQLELMLAANPGEPARPLRKVASGGELSRTMLALKTVLAAHDPVRTLVVFDEIDANVGGRLGDVLGQKLRKLGATHQILCVTHLPQVASYADHHWTIRKISRGNRTSTSITPLLTEAERIEELALMLRGEARSETTRKEAAAMLRSSRSSGKR